MINTKEVFSTFQAAKYCKTSYMSVKRWIFSGKLKAYRTPGGHFRIIKNDLLQFMKQNRIPNFENVLVKKKILIVDDDAQARNSIADFLRIENQNYDVATAENGFEAGILVTQFKPDVIILDLIMPKLDGFKVCEMIKKNHTFQDIKVLVYTGYASEENIKRAYTCGADNVLAKPVEMEKLVEELEALLL